MAVEIGTATGYTDLLAKLITFLTTNADLVTAGQEWEVLRTSASPTGENDHLLRGRGLAGTEQIHVRVLAQNLAASDQFGLSLGAFVSYNSTLPNDGQPGASALCGMALWNSAIPYWFIANGRRFTVVAKVSTVYSSMHAGFYLPYATPSENPYPIVVLGSHEDAVTHRWSEVSHHTGGFFDPSDGNGFTRHHDGTWLAVANYTNGAGGARSSLNATCVWPFDDDLNLRENTDGSYTLLPTVMHSSYSGGNVYGELDGVFFTSGFGLAAEDTVTISGATYLIVQSVYRTDRRSYAAIKLE